MSDGFPDPANPIEPGGPARRPDVAGIPVTLADGRVYLLAHCTLARGLAEVRDRMYDDLTYRKAVRVGDALEVAWLALAANYDLAPADVDRLLAGADPAAVVDAAISALFGAEGGARTYTRWALATLHAAAIDPAKVPPALVPDVLDQLVMQGRAVPQERYIESAGRMAYFEQRSSRAMGA